MEKKLIQRYYFNVPATSGTNIYTYNFKSDELYNFLSGIACPLISDLPTAEDIKIELKDDYKSILSFSPVQNWCKNTTSSDFDLTQVFRPLAVESKGKNFYLNVRVTNSDAAFSFVALFEQSNEQKEISIFGRKIEKYDMQSFTIKNAELGVNYSINLPSDFSEVAGVNFVGANNNDFFNLLLDINDNTKQLLDPVPISILKVSENVNHDKTFFPVAFLSNNKQVNIRLTEIETTTNYTASNITITFLLIK